MERLPLAVPTAKSGPVFDHNKQLKTSLKPTSIACFLLVLASHIKSCDWQIMPNKSPSESQAKPEHQLYNFSFKKSDNNTSADLPLQFNSLLDLSVAIENIHNRISACGC